MKNLIALALFAVVYAGADDKKDDAKKDDKKADAKKTKKDCTDDETACKAGAFDVAHKAVAKPDKALCTAFNAKGFAEVAKWDCANACKGACTTLDKANAEVLKTCTDPNAVVNATTCADWVKAASGDELKKNDAGCATAKTECDKTAGATTLAAGLLLATAALIF